MEFGDVLRAMTGFKAESGATLFEIFILLWQGFTGQMIG